MPKTEVNVHVGNRRKKIAEKTVEKSVRVWPASMNPDVDLDLGLGLVKGVNVNVPHIRGGNFTNRLITSMDLDEMLEASQIMEMRFRGEKIPDVNSPKVLRYVSVVSHLDNNPSTKAAAKKIQQDLNAQIVKQNKKTTNAAEAKRLYHNLMNEE